MNWNLPPHLSLKNLKKLLNPFKPRSVHGGMNSIVKYNPENDTFIKSVIGNNGLKEAKLAWQIATKWPKILQKHVPQIKGISMDIEEGGKPKAQQHIQIEMSKAKGKPLSHYLHDREIYHAVYDEVLKIMNGIESKFPKCRLGDRHPDNIFVVVDEEGNIGKITLIDLDPAYFRDVNQSIEQHIERYQKKRRMRMVIHRWKKLCNY